MATIVKNVHGHTLDLLGEAIVAGRFATGASLPPEPLLGEQLGVSRTVVREAVKSLVAKGLLVTGPKLGPDPLPLEPVAAAVDEQALGRLVGLGLVRRVRSGGAPALALTPRGRLVGGGVTAELLA